MPGSDKSSHRTLGMPLATDEFHHREEDRENDRDDDREEDREDGGSESAPAAGYKSESPAAAFDATLHEIDGLSRLVLETVGDGIFCISPDGTTTFVNPAAARMLDWTPEGLIGRQQHDVIHHSYPDGNHYPAESCPIYSVLQSGCTRHCEDEVFWRRDGSSFPVSYTSTPIHVGDRIAGAVIVFQDISERVRVERWQRSKQIVFHSITTHAELDSTLQLLADAYTAYHLDCSIAIFLRDTEGATLELAASSGLSTSLKAKLQTVRIEEYSSICGHAAFTGQDMIVDSQIDSSCNGIVDRRRSGVQRLCYLELAGTRDTCCLALPMKAANGALLGVIAFLISPGVKVPDSASGIFGQPVELNLSQVIGENGGFRGVRDLAQIAIEHRNLQTELVHQSRHDRLTGLPNSLLLEERLRQLIRAVDRNRKKLAVCSVDLDRFRRINENYGHIAGDDLLQQLTARFRNLLRKGDTLGRQGGDTFMILLPDLSDPVDAETICRKLLVSLNEPFPVDGKNLTIAANIGISIYPDHADSPELLVQHADTALGYAKEKGKASVKLFRPDLGQKIRQIAAREVALQTALQNKELYLMYQPLYDASRRVHGFEALLRWQHPELGLIPPDQFIPMAEETGLILLIGDWVLREACRQAMAWTAGKLAESKMFVNISALQLGQADFTQSVGYALRLSGLPPSRLELEVTESYIVPSFKKATQMLQPLQDLGVAIALDDFGTGHSSFSVLHKLPINAIKVDRSFVSRIDRDASGLSTVRAIVNLAHQLGMKTVGEGVETEAQFELLKNMGCDFYQGYLFSKPLTVDAVERLFGDIALSAASKEAVSGKTTPITQGANFRKSA